MEYLITSLSTLVSNVGPFILLLGLLIFVHELGHFSVAKFCGVRVETFSLGFGKKILQYKRGETTYCISLIPLGGYVKMFGDDPNMTVSDEDKKVSFLHKTLLQRTAIVLAGPIMNLLFAILIYCVVGIIGEQSKAPLLGDVDTQSEAAQLGFKSGDRVLEAQAGSISKVVKSWEDFQTFLKTNANSQVTVSLERENKKTEKIEFKVGLVENTHPLAVEEKIGGVKGLETASFAPLVGVDSKSWAETNGFKTGDKINFVGGQEIKFYRQLEGALLEKAGQDIEIKWTTVEKNAERVAEERANSGTWWDKTLILFKGKKDVVQDLKGNETLVPVEKTAILTLPKKIKALKELGLEKADTYLFEVLAGRPADKAGLRNQDKILEVNSQAVTNWDQIFAIIRAYDGKSDLDFKVLRDSEVMKFKIMPEITSQMSQQGLQEKRYTVGIRPWLDYAPTELVTLKAANMSENLTRATEKSYETTMMTLMSFVKLIQNKISAKNIGGVISIGQAASTTFKIGWSYFLQMMAAISINLFILNLLPVPVLDGGHLMFYLIEAVKGSPLSLKKMEAFQQLGFIMLMGLMVFALFNDFNRLIFN